MNMVDVLCIHVLKQSNRICGNFPERGIAGMKENDGRDETN
jgi:hypothetical protein